MSKTNPINKTKPFYMVTITVFIVILLLAIAMYSLYDNVFDIPTSDSLPSYSEETTYLFNQHNLLLQNRIQMVELLTLNESSQNFGKESIDFFEVLLSTNTENKETLVNNTYENDVLHKHHQFLNSQEVFLQKAISARQANRDEAIELLAELTTILLEYRSQLALENFPVPAVPQQYLLESAE